MITGPPNFDDELAVAHAMVLLLDDFDCRRSNFPEADLTGGGLGLLSCLKFVADSYHFALGGIRFPANSFGTSATYWYSHCL